MDRHAYFEKVELLLSDNDTYQKLKKNPTKATERRMNQLLLDLKRQGKLEEGSYSHLRSTDGSTPPFYGLVKISKDS